MNHSTHLTDLPHPTLAPRCHGPFVLHAARLSQALLLRLLAAAPAGAVPVIQYGISVVGAATADSALEFDTLSAKLDSNAHQVHSEVGEATGTSVLCALSSPAFPIGVYRRPAGPAHLHKEPCDAIHP